MRHLKNLYHFFIINFPLLLVILISVSCSTNSDKGKSNDINSSTTNEQVPSELVGKWFGEDDCLAFEITSNGTYLANNHQYTININKDTLKVFDIDGNIYWSSEFEVEGNTLTTFTTLEWGKMSDIFKKK